MAGAFNFSESELLAFALILLRVGSFLVAWPIFGTSNVPAPVKILLALILSIVLVPTVKWQPIAASLYSLDIIWIAFKEALIGALLGFVCRLYFFAVSVGGQIISLSMGLSNAQIMNPSLGSSSNIVEQFQIGLASLFFLAIDGHHLFLHGLAQSFTILPMSIDAITFHSFGEFGKVVQEVVIIGTKIAAPVLLSILFMNLAMGIIGRAVPQINVLITSLPVNILVGFIVMIISVPLFVTEMDALLILMSERLFDFMKGF